jgi:adenine phosphoribosyltransferase
VTVVDQARAAFLDRFCWAHGHANLWPAFEDPSALALLVRALVEPWRDAGVTRVVGVEARGFLLGGACAVELGAGFQAVRKAGALFPGEKLTQTAADADYRGTRHELSMQQTLSSSDVVLMVDDWAERGSQAAAVRALVDAAGARFAGLSVIVDQLTPDARAALAKVTSVVSAEELGEPS